MESACAAIFFFPRLLSCPLDHAENFSDFTLQSGEGHGEHIAARMQHDIHVARKQGKVQTQQSTHAAFDAIAFHRIAQDSAGGDADTRAYM